MTVLSMENPVFRVYLLAAAVMIAKMMSNSWLTVYRMRKVNGGFRLPEDARRTLLNPNPTPDQRFLHFFYLMTARTHDERAMAWTVGSLIVYFMIGAAAWRALWLPWPSV